MFRYVALAWDPADRSADALAQQCVQALGTEPGWQPALQHPRLRVFVGGAVDGVNRAYPLHRQRGVVVGRLFDRERAQAGTSQILQRLSSDHELAESGGRRLLEHYWGRYVAFFEDANGTLQVLRDPSGALPCFHLYHGGVTVVFSWLDDVLDLLPWLPVPRVSLQGLAAHLAFGDLTGRQTALEGVTQVLAGERAAVQATGAVPGPLLWGAADVAGQAMDLDADAAMVTLHETVVGCTQAWARCYDAILLRLSGGLDSSILATCLADGRTPARVTCLNYHSAGARSDERAFARLAAERARRKLLECERAAAFPLQRVLDVARTPSPQHYIGRITSASDAETAAAAGAQALFTGIGGDALFFERRQWWPAADYLRLRGLDRGFAAVAMDAARLGRLSVWRTLWQAAADRLRTLPPPPELHAHRLLATDRVRQQAGAPGAFVHPSFTARTGLPIGKLMQVQQMAYPSPCYDPFSRERAPEQVNPLLSQPLIELCLRLPTYVLTHGGRGRGLVRKAFEGEIPAEIASRRSKGGMEEHSAELLQSNLDFARSLLLDGQLVRLGLIDRRATEAALSGSATTQGWALVSEIHACLAAEAWLLRWPTPALA